MDLGTCLIENNGESMVLGIFDAHLQFVLVDLIVAQETICLFGSKPCHLID